jgi:hypothetical protein|tara:strand:+ start:1195 stop:1410 length:216 start_codon:yes stop_codon:yes gene_type:complete
LLLLSIREEGQENLRGEGETFSGTFARARRLLPLISFFFFATFCARGERERERERKREREKSEKKIGEKNF